MPLWLERQVVASRLAWVPELKLNAAGPHLSSLAGCAQLTSPLMQRGDHSRCPVLLVEQMR